MLIDTRDIPTHVAQVARRLNTEGPSSSGNAFLHTSYLVEVWMKTTAIALHAGLRDSTQEIAHRIAHRLIAAEGLGHWEDAIREMSAQPLAGFLRRGFRPLLAWLGRRRRGEDEAPFLSAVDEARSMLAMLGVESPESKRAPCVVDLLALLVQIRNKTKAHGAVGQDFFAEANSPYLDIVRQLLDGCPIIATNWVHLSQREDGRIRGVWLKSESTQYVKDSELPDVRSLNSGMHFSVGPDYCWCGDLLRANPECTRFLFPNGGLTATNQAEFIDYNTGHVQKLDVSDLAEAPPPLPASETEGLDALDVFSNVFGNLPNPPRDYVERPKLQQELHRVLCDLNHRMITLHGRGGIGKTSLALRVAHSLADQEDCPFEEIVWFSGRDIDLRISGPTPVRQKVLSLADIAGTYGDLFGRDTSVEAFAEAIQGSHADSGVGALFIFDNFETLSDVAGIYEFLDTHTHLPNKVLITSRERAFKADYPVEVGGMEQAEARELLVQLARRLGVESLVNDQIIEDIYKETGGHAYVMRIVIGEFAKEKRRVSARRAIPSRMDVVSAVFERSFNKLSDDGRRIFLTVSNWKSAVSELALLVVLGQREIDVDSGVDECRRMSLVMEDSLSDDFPCYYAPELARVFGKKKLEGDPDRLLIQEDLAALRSFGVVTPGRAEVVSQGAMTRGFVEWCFRSAEGGREEDIQKYDHLLESLAAFWTQAWSDLARYRIQFHLGSEDIEYALRRSVEEMPGSSELWLKRARYAKSVRDDATCVASYVGAVEAAPDAPELLKEASLALCKYVSDHKDEIPAARRGVYLASVRDLMEKVSHKLDADGLSRLAWLYLLEGNQDMARKYAQLGLESDPRNVHCIRLLERLSW